MNNMALPVSDPKGIEPSEPGAIAFVWGTWAMLFALCLAYVARFGSDLPQWDDWGVVPYMIGERPISLGWLWSLQNEHRIVLPRLVMIGAYRLIGDFRAALVFIAVSLGLVSAGLIAFVRHARGRMSYADALLPMLLLNPGHGINLLWAIQLAYVLPICCFSLVLVSLGWRPERPGTLSLIVAATGLAMLPLGNAAGVAMVPGLVAWFGSIAARRFRENVPHGRLKAILVLLLTLPGFLFLILYSRGYTTGSQHPAASDVLTAARTANQFLAVGLGPPGIPLWPFSGVCVLSLMGLSVLCLAWTWAHAPRDRPQAFGFACCVAAFGVVVLGIGWGRGGQGDQAGLQERYSILAAPGVFLSYLILTLHAPRRVRRLTSMTLLVGTCVLLWPDTESGLQHGREIMAQTTAFHRDVLAGMPVYRLARRYTPALHPSQEELATELHRLRKARVGPFARLQDDPPFHTSSLPIEPRSTHLVRWEPGGLASVTGVDPWLAFDLEHPRYVAGLRIRYDHTSDSGSPAHFKMRWQGPGASGREKEQEYQYWFLTTGEDRVFTVWLDDVVSQFAIQPDNGPCRFRIRELTLIEP